VEILHESQDFTTKHEETKKHKDIGILCVLGGFVPSW